jgi:hypothetical protein
MLPERSNWMIAWERDSASMMLLQSLLMLRDRDIAVSFWSLVSRSDV